jgi:hypothetical protein
MLYKIMWLPRYNWKIVESGVKHHRAIKHTFIGRLEETSVPGEDHPPVTSHWQTLSHNVVSWSSRGGGLYILVDVT